MAKAKSRREFITGLSLLTAAGLMKNPYVADEISADFGKKEGLRFLFQGDSITDGNRGLDNDPNHIMGHGYAFSIASRAGAFFPERKLSFF